MRSLVRVKTRCFGVLVEDPGNLSKDNGTQRGSHDEALIGRVEIVYVPLVFSANDALPEGR